MEKNFHFSLENATASNGNIRDIFWFMGNFEPVRFCW